MSLRSSRVARRVAGALLSASLAVSTAGCFEARAVAPVDPGPSQPVVEYVTHQEILTPLPLRVRLPARYGAERVLVFYRPWGVRGYRQLELARAGQTWSGHVSCREVSTVTGDTRYFFLALDRDGAPVAGSGSPDWPHVVTVVGALASGPAALPGEAPPVRCYDPADCPPDFPGCPKYTLLRPVCRADADCDGGRRCAWDGYCEPAGVDDITGSDDELLAAAVRKATHGRNVAEALGVVRR